MRRFLLSSLLIAASATHARDPKPISNPDRFCQDAKELAMITSQLPDYVLSEQVETSASVVPPLKFKPMGVLSAARGQPVCIAVVVSETGVVQDAAVYFPKRVALSREERRQLLSNTYLPAKQAGQAVKSIVIMKAWSN